MTPIIRREMAAKSRRQLFNVRQVDGGARVGFILHVYDSLESCEERLMPAIK